MPNPRPSVSVLSLSTPGIQSALHTPLNPRPRALAIIAHPWARLGGSWSDPVVQTLLQTFLSLSIPTAVYNGRGAGKTTLRPSWTGREEVNDYGRVVEAARKVAWGDGAEEGGELYLCGYSYGALLALAQQPLEGVKTSYIAVSPAPNFSFFFLPFQTPSPIPLPCRVLLFHGSDDAICSPDKAERWVREKLVTSEDAQDRLDVVVREGENHFWRGEGGLEAMGERARRWVEERRSGSCDSR